MVGGALLAALAASACCVLPVVLVGLGITGAWMAHLRALEPWRPYLLVGAWTLWAGALYRERTRPLTCDADGTCPSRSYRIYWVSGVLLFLFSASPWFLRLM